jgi:hypothetical protein
MSSSALQMVGVSTERIRLNNMSSAGIPGPFEWFSAIRRVKEARH